MDCRRVFGAMVDMSCEEGGRLMMWVLGTTHNLEGRLSVFWRKVGPHLGEVFRYLGGMGFDPFIVGGYLPRPYLSVAKARMRQRRLPHTVSTSQTS